MRTTYIGGGAAGIPGNLVSVDASDTTPNYLASKLVVNTGLSLTVLNPGGNEQLRVNSEPAPFKATYYVDPAFTGTQTGSQSNPMTTIAAAFAAMAALALGGGIIKIPPATTITENVVFPATGGIWEIEGEGFSGSSTGSRITGTVTLNVTSGVLTARLNNLIINGNTSGNAGTGTVLALNETCVRQNGSITLTTSGTGLAISFFRGIGAPVASKTGGSNTLLVSVAGAINAENWVFEGGFIEAPASATTPYPGSQFQMCWFGSTSGSPIPIGLNGLTLNCAFYDCIFVGPTTFTAGVSNYTVYMDGASLASLNNPIAGAILVGTGIQLKTLNANASDKRTLNGNLVSTAFGARNTDGLYEVSFDVTLLVAGTLGSLQLNAIYTDITGTLITAPVGAPLNIAGVLGDKQSGSKIFRHNGAAAPIAFSYTGIVTPGAMSVASTISLTLKT